MAIFIPAGGSIMMRGGPVFWSAPMRREHSAGNFSLVGPASFPDGVDRFFLSPSIPGDVASGGVDCVSLIFDAGGTLHFPIILSFSFRPWWAFTLSMRFRLFIGSVLRFTSPNFITHNTHSDTAARVLQSSVTIPVMDIAPNIPILIRAEFNTNVAPGVAGSPSRLGLRILGLTSSLPGIVSSFPHATTGVMSATPDVHPSPPVESIGTRPAPPIRVVAPMSTIPSWARRVAM